MKKTTLKDLARALNLSCSAVSSALNRRPNIPIATQERVRKMADKMGYMADARVVQLMSYLRAGKGSRSAPNLAWLYWQENNYDQGIRPWQQGYLDGARNRANALGYAIDLIRFTSPEYPVHRLNSVFHSRGIEGVILINPCWPSPLEASFRWSEFALVSLEGMEGDPGLPHVGSLGIKCLQVTFDNLIRLGYRRPGFVIGEWVNQVNTGQWAAGFLEQQRQLSEADRIPVLIEEMWPALLPEWLRTYRPDVVICAASETIDLIRKLGYRVPEDVAVVHLNLSSDVSGWAGIDERHEEIGAATVDVVTAQLNRGERGLNDSPKYIYICGKWVDGWTCPNRAVP